MAWRATILGMISCGLALSGPVRAQAQSKRIYVIADALDPELENVAARAGSSARGALRAIEDAEWQDADRRFLGYDESTAGRLHEARDLLEQGRAAYLDLQLDRAIELLGQSLDLFDSSLAAVEDPTELGQVLLYLGASQEFNGNSRAARRTFERMQLQMPHVRPDPDEFPPQVVDRYNEAAPAPGSGSVSVASDPPGATAYVDFIPRGTTPITVAELARGQHLIRVAQPGATPYLEPVEIRRSAQVNAFLMEAEGNEGMAAAIASITGQQLESATGPLQEVGNLLNLDLIGMIRVSFGDTPQTVKLVFAIFEVASGRRIFRGELQAPRAPGELELSVRSAVTAAVETVLDPAQAAVDTEDSNRDPDVDADVDDDDDDGESIIGKWWFWTAIGGAVLLGAVIAIAVVASGGDELGSQNGTQVVLEFGR